MKIKEFLAPGHVQIDVRAADKATLLRDLSARTAVALGLPEDAVASEIEKREELGSTGIGHGVSTRMRAFRD